MSAARCDVVVVGGGLVGLAAALGLQREGYEVAVLERGLGPRKAATAAGGDDYDLRVYAIAPATQRFLQSLDVWPAIAAARVSAYQRMRVWEQDPRAALVFDAADIHAPALGHIIENSVLLDALWQALRPGTCRAGTELLSLERHPDCVRLQLGDGSVLEPALVIAADGRDSPVRSALGIELTAGEYAQTAVVCHVQTEQAHAETAWQHFLPSGPLALLPLADGRSSIVWSSTEAASLLQLDDAAFCMRLGAASQHVLGAVLATTRRLSFPLGMQNADQYAVERGVLIGDAAHIVHPLAGQGVNLGFGDAEALVEVLAQARTQRRDPGSLRLLKRFERARRADVLDMVAVTDALYRAYALQLPGWDALRAWGLGAVNALPPLKHRLIRRAAGLN